MKNKKLIGSLGFIEITFIILVILALLLSVWHLLAVLLWLAYYYEWPVQIKAYKKTFGQKLLIVLVVVTFILVGIGVNSTSSSSSNSNSNSNSSSNSNTTTETKTYEIKTAQADGIVRTSPTEFNGTQVDVVMVLTDSSIKNNGKCIDQEGSWCSNDPDGQHNALAETRYHYGLTFKGTENDEYVAASTLVPIYCNKSELVADLAQFIDKPYEERTDYTCDGWRLANWKPTDSFLFTYSSVRDSLDSLLNTNELALYDIHKTFTVKYTTTANSGTLSEGNSLNSNQFKDQPFVKSYPISLNN